MYLVYILRCKDNSLYTGITNNLQRRLDVHTRKKGSKYVASRLPFKLVYLETMPNKSLALKREIEIKKMTKQQKEKIIKRIFKHDRDID